MNTTLFKNFQSFRASLNESFLEREAVVDGLLASLITKQNAFLFGVPGTGKSELVRSVSNGFSNTKFFGYLLSPTTDPSELFGPVAVSKLLKDEYVRDVEGYLPSSNVAFLDELFRGSSAVLNSLLTILNERTFNNGKETIKTPIQSIVAATNSFPTEEALQAFCDRFLFRPTVELLSKPTSKKILDHWALGITPRPGVESSLSFADLEDLQKEASEVMPSENFLEVFSSVIDMLATRGITISDRRRVQILKFLRGYTIVQGEKEIFPEFLHETLVHIVYQTPDDISVIKEVLTQLVPTAEKLHKEIKRAISGVMAEFHAFNSKKFETLNEVNEQVKKFRKIHADLHKLGSKVDEMLEDTSCRMTMTIRQRFVKTAQEIENEKQLVARSIANLSN
jgi:MoxR-like ATPase